MAGLKEYCAGQGWALEEPNYEGVRVNFGPGEGDGWFLVRLSLHDPVIPVNIESDTPGGAGIMAARMRAFLRQYEELEIPEDEK